MPAFILDTSALVDAKADASSLQAAHDAIAQAGRLIAEGAIVIFATETFYGVAALPTDPVAVARLAAIKGRDKDKPIALIASDLAACEAVVTMPDALRPLAAAFWPGPLTLLLPAQAQLSHPIVVPSAQGLRVGVRVSSHPVARALSRAAGGIITATSANLSGKPAVSCARTLDPELLQRVDVVLDAGKLVGEAPSSVVGLGEHGLEVVRPGAISQDALMRIWREVPHAGP